MKALALRCAVIGNTGLAISLLLIWFHQAYTGAFWQSDFTAFYTGASIVRHGEGNSLYDLPTQAEYLAWIVPDQELAGRLFFNYPPHTALATSALALLPRNTAFFTWAFIQLLLLILFLRQAILLTANSPGGNLDSTSQTALITALCAFPGVFVSFQMGQISLLEALATLSLYRALESRQTTSAVLWLLIGSLKPQAILPTAILALFLRPRVVLFAALAFLPLVVLPMPFLGIHCWQEWLGIIRLTAVQTSGYGVFPQAMFNFRNLVFAFFGPDQISLVNAMVLGMFFLSFALISILAWSVRNASLASMRRRLGLGLLVCFLGVPHLNPADTVMYCIPALLFWSSLRTSDPWRIPLGGFLLCCPFLLLVDLYGLPFWFAQARTFVAILVLLAGSMAIRLTQGKPHCEDLPSDL